MVNRAIHLSMSSGLALDGLTTGIKAAYSTRRLLTAYAGNAMTVTRISDHTTQNIGFVSDVLDTTSLATFCSGTTGVITTWYDQSGGGLNLTQAEASAPYIYQSGAVKVINTKPAPFFDFTIPQHLVNTSLTANPVNTQWSNVVVSIPAAQRAILGTPIVGAFILRINSSSAPEILSSGTASIGVATSSISASTGVIIENHYTLSSGAWQFWINRVSAGTGTQTQALTAGSVDIGEDRATDPVNGSIGEIILYDLVGGIPSASQSSITLNQKTYWGTP